jgi:hypothetical protein
MKNIEYFQQFKKNLHVLNAKCGKFLYKPFHISEQILPFTPLENLVIYGGDNINKDLIPYRKSGVKTPSFLTWLTTLSIPAKWDKYEKIYQGHYC